VAPNDQQPVEKALTSRKPGNAADLSNQILEAARLRGVSAMAIGLAIFKSTFGRHQMGPLDYFKFRLYRRDLTAKDREEFVSDAEISRLNAALRPSDKKAVAGIINSKIMTEMLLRGVGLPHSPTLALARSRGLRLPFPVLVGANAIEAFLKSPGTLPVFGKPDSASLGVGAASFLRLDGDTLVLGDGSSVGLHRICEEISRDYPDGYLFQKILMPHPELAKLIGPVVGTLRVLSLQLERGPEPLFVMLKMPGPGAMVDGALSGSNAAAFVDPETGRILRAQLLSQPIGKDLLHNHVTGAPLPGAVLPDFKEAVALALNVHRLFPQLGVLGSDVILSDRGPLINEVNLNPLASLVQNARGHGLFDETFKAKYRRALAVQGVKLPIKGVRL
jgi:Sugar-transfer associated ATP-grasp